MVWTFLRANMGTMCRVPLSDERSLGKVTRVIRSFYHVLSVAPFLFLLIYFICCTHTTNWVTMCRASLLGQKVKVQGHTGHWNYFCRVRCVAPPLFDQFISYVAHTQPMM